MPAIPEAKDVESANPGKHAPGAVSGLLAVSLALIATSAPPLRASASDDVEPEEYGIYSAVLSDAPLRKDARVLIHNETLNFRCGGDSGNPILLNGCSGMIIPPDTPEQVGESLRRNWPKLAATVWSEFERRNAKSAKLRDAFLTPYAHELAGPDLPGDTSKEWVPPEGAFCFSRVGFNPPKTAAVVFVFFASYVDGVPSTGNYFLLGADPVKRWKLDGRFEYFKSGGQANEGDSKPPMIP